LLEYLQKYVANPKILELAQLSPAEQGRLPVIWRDILSHEGDARLSVTLRYWQQYQVEFEQVVEYLADHLVSVHLIHHGFGYCLLYGVTSADGAGTLYYEGRNPVVKTISPDVAPLWDLLPKRLTSFYDEFHNGWYYLASGSMGLSPVEDFFFLDEEEWGILDEINEPSLDLAHTLAVYTNGMGGYLCLETHKPDLPCLLWSAKKPPLLGLEFWPTADSWTTMGFES